MPLSPEDDFGRTKPQKAKTRRAPGACSTPRDLIGNPILGIPAEPRFTGIRDLVRLAASRRQGSEATPREENIDTPTPSSSSKNCKAALKYGVRHSSDSAADDLIFAHDVDGSGRSQEIELQEEAQCSRRLKKPVIGTDGKALDAQKTSTSSGRPVGLRTMDMIPSAQKHPQAGSKRLFAWIHRPTAWENPVTYEDPPEPGKRPSHPVSSTGGVALDRKRMFPEKAPATGIPPPRMSKAPTGAWGGWANGAPGRKMTEGLWEVEPRERELVDGEEAEFRGSDARLKMNHEIKYRNTSWLTNWHWDARGDIDPPRKNQYRENMPMASCTTTREESVYCAPAGKSSALAERSRAKTPMSAR